MEPTKETDHVAKGVDALIGQYRGQPNLTAFLTAFLQQVQELEDVTWDVIASQKLSRTIAPGPPDQALLQLADLVGCPIGTYDGPQLAFLIQVWIQARKSKGRSEDLLGILAKVFPGAFNFDEYFPAAYEATLPSLTDATFLSPLAQALRIARPQGVNGVLTWGTWPTATFFFGDSASGAAGSGLMDAISSTNAQYLLSALKV